MRLDNVVAAKRGHYRDFPACYVARLHWLAICCGFVRRFLHSRFYLLEQFRSDHDAWPLMTIFGDFSFPGLMGSDKLIVIMVLGSDVECASQFDWTVTIGVSDALDTQQGHAGGYFQQIDRQLLGRDRLEFF